MHFDERPKEDEQVDQEEVWSVIRYLDPNERDKDREAKIATIIAVLALLLMGCAVWVVIWLRVRHPSDHEVNQKIYDPYHQGGNAKTNADNLDEATGADRAEIGRAHV